MAFADDKACALEKIRAFGCNDVAVIDTALTGYDKIVDLVLEYSNTFDCNPAYLTALLTCFDGPSLVAEGIYFNQTGLTTVTNPKLVVDTEAGAVVLDSGDTIPEFGILGSSKVDLLTVKDATVVEVLIIGSAASVEQLKSNLDASDACVGYLRVQACKNYFGKLGVILRGGCVTTVKADPGTTYGGFDCAPVSGTCGDAVSALAVSQQTAKTFLVTWTQPSNSLYVNVRYREKGEQWQTAGADNTLRPGHWIYEPVTGFQFNRMKPDTYYEIEITNVCTTGQLSAPVSVTAKTTA